MATTPAPVDVESMPPLPYGRNVQLLRLLGLAVTVGILGALAVLAFHQLLLALEAAMYGSNQGLVADATRLPPEIRVIIPALGGLVAGLVLQYFLGRGKGETGADYMEAIAAGDEVPWRSSLLKSAASAATVVSGGSIGREGSMVQLAALSGGLLGKVLPLSLVERRFAVACGAAAGLAGAYNTPIAGALFVAEIVLDGISVGSFGPLLLAAAIADSVVRHVSHVGPIFAAAPGNLQSLPELLLVVATGIAAGLLGPLFIGALNRAHRGLAVLRWPLWLKMAFAGLAVGGLSAIRPEVWGNGYSVVNSLLHQPWLWQSVLLILVLKVVATVLTSGSGAVGGVFTPTLFVGAALGTLAGSGVQLALPGASMTAFTLVGMSAFLAAVTHAPLTAVVMVSEMTSGYGLVPALVLASLAGYYVSSVLHPGSIYAQSIPQDHPTQNTPSIRL
ncbi:MAG: chloride channel protein [Gammaproteobacteria bacterium]|nr:chloride channel protein [Gammaproteobacteria bacterium]